MSSSGPSIVPVACYSACEIAWYIQEKPVVAVCGVVPVVASAGTSLYSAHTGATDGVLLYLNVHRFRR